MTGTTEWSTFVPDLILVNDRSNFEDFCGLANELSIKTVNRLDKDFESLPIGLLDKDLHNDILVIEVLQLNLFNLLESKGDNPTPGDPEVTFIGWFL